MKRRVSLMAALAVAAFAAGCGDEDGGATGGGEISQTESALLGNKCGGIVTNNCWGPVSQGQSLAFDYYPGFAWFIRILNQVEVWPIGQSWTAGYLDANGNGAGGLPRKAKSVAVQTSSGLGTVFALTDDNVVRYSTGTPASSQAGADGTNFAHWNVYIQPLDKSGTSLCLSKIVSLSLPTNFGQGRLLTALSCGGGLYVQDAVNGVRRWMPATQHPAFIGLPSVAWMDISHHRDGGAALLSKNGRNVYRTALGSTSANGSVTWRSAQVLPQITKGGVRLLPSAVGGRYVITEAGAPWSCTVNVGCDGDDDRFYRYDPSTAAWVRHTGGMPWVPGGQAELPVPNVDAPYDYNNIVDTGKGFMVRHRFSWMMPYTEPLH